MEPVAELNATHDRVALKIERELDARGLEQLIHELAELRAHMIPSVPRTLEEAMAADVQVIQQDQPSAMFRALADGGLRIWLRNLGLGWMAFRIPRRDVDGLRDLLTGKVSETPRTH
ncbi:MAG TPA: hypothetical protein VFH59_17380 [Frateuria sp.]|uniref:hypothetical protein n=1 Tax=Frateuria sp. TaxID=2211372 RepID=UPI002D80FD5D|nr:hypothetical protein [Frateuria sp.]HET6807211.1 hypothetical protein [Frateuria sp.]